LNVLRELQSIVASGTSLSQIELLVAEIIELVSTMSTTTSTSDSNLNVIRGLASTITSTTSTSDISRNCGEHDRTYCYCCKTVGGHRNTIVYPGKDGISIYIREIAVFTYTAQNDFFNIT
jgi:hypothetical protein